MSEGDLEKILITVGEKKSLNGKKNLQVEGLANIHPVYEALIALFKNNIADMSLTSRFNITDEQFLRTTMVTDALMDRLSGSQRSTLEGMYRSGTSLKEILDRAALYLAEDKRTQGGEVLYNASEEAGKTGYFMLALASANPRRVYVQNNELEDVKERAKTIRNTIRGGVITGLILAAGIAAGSYFFSKNYDIHIVPQGEKIEQAESYGE